MHPNPYPPLSPKVVEDRAPPKDLPPGHAWEKSANKSKKHEIFENQMKNEEQSTEKLRVSTVFVVFPYVFSQGRKKMTKNITAESLCKLHI